MNLKDLAFNADIATELEIIHLLKYLNIEIGIETGTSHGSTTLLLSDVLKQVYTVEVKEDIYKDTKRNLSRCKNINFYLGSSENKLEDIFTDIKLYKESNLNNKILKILNENKIETKVMTEVEKLMKINNNDLLFFYLDAHWYEYWPILDELEVISKNCQNNAIIVIDDFKVPDRDFGFTIDYNIGKILDYEYIKEKLEKIYPDGYTYWYDDIAQLRIGYDHKGITGKFYVVPKRINIPWLKTEFDINYSGLLNKVPITNI
jgi:hypothetical protein